jgi:CRP/FNR family transcriptional regulator, cyclic AMP receptor protein
MSTNARRETKLRLSEHQFFQGFESAFVGLLEKEAVERRYTAGDLLVREGDPADKFLLIFEGKVALEIATAEKPHLTIETIGPGDALGWSWLFPPQHWRLDGRALKETRALELDADFLRETLDAHPTDAYQFVLRLLPMVAERLENTRVQLLDIYGA